jgi:hypothetical protein
MKIAILDNQNPTEGYTPRKTEKRYTAIGFNPIGIELERGTGETKKEAVFNLLDEYFHARTLEGVSEMVVEITKSF